MRIVIYNGVENIGLKDGFIYKEDINRSPRRQVRERIWYIGIPVLANIYSTCDMKNEKQNNEQRPPS